MARDKVGQLLGLNPTETRDLSDNFSTLVESGILEVVTPYDKAKRQATTYRYVPQTMPANHAPVAKESLSVLVPSRAQPIACK
jgi:hypothetical protein